MLALKLSWFVKYERPAMMNDGDSLLCNWLYAVTWMWLFPLMSKVISCIRSERSFYKKLNCWANTLMNKRKLLKGLFLTRPIFEILYIITCPNAWELHWAPCIFTHTVKHHKLGMKGYLNESICRLQAHWQQCSLQTRSLQHSRIYCLLTK